MRVATKCFYFFIFVGPILSVGPRHSAYRAYGYVNYDRMQCTAADQSMAYEVTWNQYNNILLQYNRSK